MNERTSKRQNARRGVAFILTLAMMAACLLPAGGVHIPGFSSPVAYADSSNVLTVAYDGINIEESVNQALLSAGVTEGSIEEIRLRGTASVITEKEWEKVRAMFTGQSKWSALTALDLSEMGQLVELRSTDQGTPTRLKKAVLPDGLKMIGDYAFYNCSGLGTIEIPDSVETIGSSAFLQCYSLKTIEIPDKVETIGYRAFYGCKSLTIVTLGRRVKTMGTGAFSGCESLPAVTLGENVETIGASAFSGCKSLSTVTLGGNVETIGDNAFLRCSSLGAIVIPDSVETIGWGVFANCSSLTTITLGRNVKTIGGSAFLDCSSLAAIVFTADTQPGLGTDWNSGTAPNQQIFYPAGCDYAGITPTPSAVEFLSSLTVSAVGSTSGSLSFSEGPFQKGNSSYTVNVPQGMGEIFITAGAVSPAAVISGGGVQSLRPGANPFKIQVSVPVSTKAGDLMAVRNYHVTVNQAVPSSGGGSSRRSQWEISLETPEPPQPVIAVMKLGNRQEKGPIAVIVPDDRVTSALKQALETAKKLDREQYGVALSCRVEANPDAEELSGGLTFTLKQQTLERLLAEEVRFLSLESGASSLTLDLEALKETSRQTAGDLIFRMEKAGETELTQEARELLAGRPAFRFTLTSDLGEMKDFGKGAVSGGISYTPGRVDALGKPAENGSPEKTEGLSALAIGEDGSVTRIPGSVFDEKKKQVVWTQNHLSVYGVGYQPERAASFTDTSGHWAEESIEYVYERGILLGTGDGRFSPNQSMSRGMLVTALGRIAEVDPADHPASRFHDVPVNSYYAGYIEWAAENGIAEGTEKDIFQPDRPVTREEAVALLYRFAQSQGLDVSSDRDLSEYGDAGQVAEWAVPAFRWSCETKLIAGKPGSLLAPEDTLTRAECAALLHRLMSVVKM